MLRCMYGKHTSRHANVVIKGLSNGRRLTEQARLLRSNKTYIDIQIYFI